MRSEVLVVEVEGSGRAGVRGGGAAKSGPIRRNQT